MPRRRKYSSANAIMKKRLGATGWGGSRPFFPWSKSLTTRTLGEGHNPGTTCGVQFFLAVNNWNDPMTTLIGLVAGTGSLTSNRHPMNHDNAIARGYNRVNVFTWKAEIDVNWIVAQAPTLDFFVAYQFQEDFNSEITLTAGTAARIERMELFTNPRWTIKHFNAAPGDATGAKKGGHDVVIYVPSIQKYGEFIAGGNNDLLADNGSLGHALADVAYSSNPPVIPIVCNVVIFTESGLAMPIDSVHVTVAVTQKVKIYRDAPGGENMDDGEADVHA